MGRILVVEDDLAACAALRAVLDGLGHEVFTAPSAELALEDGPRAAPDVVLLDLHLPGKGGIEVLPDLLALPSRPAVAVLTAAPTAENAIDALARGATAHLAKPVDEDRVAAVVEECLQQAAARRAGEGPQEADLRPALVGSSPAMLELGRRVGALARSDCTVVVRGESGTGKELVARAIHARSARAGGPLVAVSCAALPEALVESELFGHVKGAFTGAHQARQGKVAQAEGGTLFLDEVGELTASAQAKLLRFLETRSYAPVGGGAVRQADVRVLAATNAPLEARVGAGEFREDLFFRLHVATVTLPPLRERPADVPLLVEHFLNGFGRGDVGVPDATLNALRAHPWPGNVRQLRNALEAAVVGLGPGGLLAPGRVQPAGDVPPGDASVGTLEASVRALVAEASPDDPGLFARVRGQVERALIAAALERTGGNQVAAAALLGMNRATFRRKMTDFALGGSGGPTPSEP